jgi:stringent starvation protein B
MTQVLPPKKEVALALLERSNVDVYLDPRAEGVVVPPQFRKEPRLILKIGLNMPVPIPDLRLDDESMSCTLSFNRTKFFCVVPWLSVFAMVGDDGRGMVWPDDVPQELAVRAESQRPSGAPVREELAPVPSSGRGSGKGKSRIQPDGSAESSAASAGPKSKRPRKKKDEAPARPVLVAVPPPEKSSPRVEKLDDRREANASASTTAGTSERPPERVSPPPRVSATPAGPRPKRELPPYLRVVK